MTIEESFNLVKKYCEKQDFKGWDCYDGLNSMVFKLFPFLRNSKLARLVWIQIFKKSPINFRKLFLVEKDYNPKALGLFLTAYCNLYQLEAKEKCLTTINFLAYKIIEFQSIGYSGACWGYNFDWQAKAFFQPKYTPTVVATCFIANALFDAYELTANEKFLQVAISSKDFVLKDLNRTYDEDGGFAFSYSPLDKTQVFNASLLGSRLLSRIYHFTKENELLTEARKTIEFCIRHQNQDGSWVYSPLPHHQWIDNFHTGYNLECIAEYQKFTGDNRFQNNIDKGFDFYIKTFFTTEGMSKYYHNSIFPVDIHAPAQLIVTLRKLDKLKEYRELAERVLNWTIENMQSKVGYFYFQKNNYSTNKIPYMRWSQAWMFLGLSHYLLFVKQNQIKE